MTLAVVGARVEGETVGLRAEGGRIVELGPGVEGRTGDELIEAEGKALVPGLVNGHTHAAMTLFRGHGDDRPLMEWLREVIWPVEARLTDDDVYWGTRLACVEMVRTGTVRFWDMYWRPGATARAVEDAGLRATVGAPLIDLGDAAGGGSLPDAAERALEEVGEARELVQPALAPHAIYTVSEPSLRWIADASRERELPVQIHLSETEDEVARCVAEHGARPAVARQLPVDVSPDADMPLLREELGRCPVQVTAQAIAVIGVGVLEVVRKSEHGGELAARRLVEIGVTAAPVQ